MTKWRGGTLVMAALAALACAPTGSLAAQDTGDARADAAGRPSAYVEPGHWARTALRRLDALGLLPHGAKVGDGPVTRAEVAALLDSAAVAGGDGPGADLVATYQGLFCGEFPAACGPNRDTGSGWFTGSRGELGYLNDSGRLLTAVARTLEPIVDPEPAGDIAGGVAAADVAVTGAWAAARARATVASDGVAVQEAYGTVRWGRVGIWGGRRTLGFGYGRETIVLGGRVPLDGVGVEVAPARLPWLLRSLGPVRFSTGLFQLDHVEPWDSPWFFTTRGTVSPVKWLSLGVTRGAQIVTEPDDGWTKVRRVLEVLIGMHSVVNRRDNQVATVDVEVRSPFQAVPVAFFLEWGFEDSAGAWIDVPGVVWGLYLGAVPGAESLAVGFQHTSIAGRCCGNPAWYRHNGFMGGWADSRVPLGHSLGGHGMEWRAWTDIALPLGTATVELFERLRHSENLFVPGRQGRSRGIGIETAIRPAPRVEVGGTVAYEAGGSWNQALLDLRVSYLF